MMTNHNISIDAALDSYPLAPLPRGFVRSTMKAIQPKPRFRPGFLDLALPAFFVFFGLSTVLVVLTTFNMLSPFVMIEIQSYIQIVAFHLLKTPLPVLAMFILLGTLVLTILCAGALFWLEDIQRTSGFRTA